MKTTKNIVFTGFMGVGKTTIAKIVAEKLGRKFIDIDYEIEKKHQQSASEIFAQSGEAFFRLEEREMIQQCSGKKHLVLSLGGGAFLNEDTRKYCMDNHYVIFLDISWQAWLDRLPLLMENRPVLENKSIDEMKTLFEFRQTTYQTYHDKILTDDKSPHEIADYIVKTLR